MTFYNSNFASLAGVVVECFSVFCFCLGAGCAPLAFVSLVVFCWLLFGFLPLVIKLTNLPIIYIYIYSLFMSIFLIVMHFSLD